MPSRQGKLQQKELGCTCRTLTAVPSILSFHLLPGGLQLRRRLLRGRLVRVKSRRMIRRWLRLRRPTAGPMLLSPNGSRPPPQDVEEGETAVLLILSRHNRMSLAPGLHRLQDRMLRDHPHRDCLCLQGCQVQQLVQLQRVQMSCWRSCDSCLMRSADPIVLRRVAGTVVVAPFLA